MQPSRLALHPPSLAWLQAPAQAAPAQPAVQRGKDGHLTLGFNNDDFFKDPMGGGRRSGTGSGGGVNSYGAGAAGGQQQGRAPEVEAVAQKRFANAKAISSKWVVTRQPSGIGRGGWAALSV
jgi:hypothetical protein